MSHREGTVLQPRPQSRSWPASWLAFCVSTRNHTLLSLWHDTESNSHWGWLSLPCMINVFVDADVIIGLARFLGACNECHYSWQQANPANGRHVTYPGWHRSFSEHWQWTDRGSRWYHKVCTGLDGHSIRLKPHTCSCVSWPNEVLPVSKFPSYYQISTAMR